MNVFEIVAFQGIFLLEKINSWRDSNQGLSTMKGPPNHNTITAAYICEREKIYLSQGIPFH